jgi:segregation and condensation protein B
MSAADDRDHFSETSAAWEPDTLPMFPKDSKEIDADGFWSGEDLERAYQEALTALDRLEQELPVPIALFDAEREFNLAEEEGDSVQSLNDFPGFGGETKPADSDSQPKDRAETILPLPRIQPAKIIEAALFVGGMPLTVKRLAGVLREEFERDFIERVIDELNLRYDEEHRPYEIRLEEGGYRMVLRPEFESVRNKIYGFGPKEVRLSRESLEVLALVAYRQPITKEQIEWAGKTNANAVLRQLLRREIIGLKRTGNTAKEVSYHTTPRFLQIFGLADLGELPRGEDLSFK